MLEATIVIDNIAQGNLKSEWGFCVYIEYNGKKYLLDTGGSDLYLENAKKLNIDVADIDYAILSHAHVDHSKGFPSFFRVNSSAKLYIADTCQENCYFKIGPIKKYVGIPKGILKDQKERIVSKAGLVMINPGVYLVPHIENKLEVIGKRAHMARKTEHGYIPDNFSHEQSLVFETKKGLVVFNSCSHGGLPNIMKDIQYYLPNQKVYMTVGGLHLAGMSKKSVQEIACMIKELSIEKVVTGHCTGKKAFQILKDEIGENVQQTHVGMKIEMD